MLPNPTMKKKLVCLLLSCLIASSSLLVACGKSGPLYLPEPQQTPSPEK